MGQKETDIHYFIAAYPASHSGRIHRVGSELSGLNLSSGHHKLLHPTQKTVEIDLDAPAEVGLHVDLLGCFEQVGLQDRSVHY